MADVRYQPGEWFGLVSDLNIAVLPDGLDDGQLQAVWLAFQAGGGLTGVLDALTSSYGFGLDSLPPFAVATLDGQRLRIAVRGDVIADVTERIDGVDVVSTMSGDSVTTWSERAVDNPVSLNVHAGRSAEASGRTLPVSQGVVLVSRLTATYVDDLETRESATRSGPGGAVFGDTQVPDITVDGSRSSEPAQSDHDGATISVAQLRAMQAAAVGAPSRGHIDVSTGERIELGLPIIIGRRPEALRVAPDEIPHLVRVPSPEHDISRSHLEIRVEGLHVVVRDLATTNGSVLRRPGHPPLTLQAETPTLVVSDDVIDIGDGVSVTFVGLP